MTMERRAAETGADITPSARRRLERLGYIVTAYEGAWYMNAPTGTTVRCLFEQAAWKVALEHSRSERPSPPSTERG